VEVSAERPILDDDTPADHERAHRPVTEVAVDVCTLQPVDRGSAVDEAADHGASPVIVQVLGDGRDRPFGLLPLQEP
jgi:hypothetical protein